MDTIRQYHPDRDNSDKKKKDKHIYNHLQVNVNQKVQDIYSALHRPLKLKENEDPNEHGSISLRRGIKA